MGSFFHVVAHRLSNNLSIISPGSHCEGCNHYLKWYELIPILSYVIQRGKCRVCHMKLSIWYPFVEFITGSLYLFSFLYFGLSYEFLISIVICSLLVIICISDFNYLIILDEPLIIGSVLVLFIHYLKGGFSLFISNLLGGVLLFLFMLFIKILGDFVFKRESLGGGDIKLSFFIGVVLGYKLALPNLVLACFLTLPFATYYLIKTREKEIPFGPFLIISTFIIYIFSDPILSFIEILLKL